MVAQKPIPLLEKVEEDPRENWLTQVHLEKVVGVVVLVVVVVLGFSGNYIKGNQPQKINNYSNKDMTKDENKKVNLN